MAATFGAAPSARVIRINLEDVDGEQVIKTFEVGGETTNAQIAAMLDALAVASNCKFNSCTVSDVYAVTGLPAVAQDVLQNSIGMILSLVFSKTDPINSAKTIEKGFVIPAYLNALKGVDLLPVSNNASLNAITDFLVAHLTVKVADGTYSTGSWTYNRARSRFGSTLRKIDALPG